MPKLAVFLLLTLLHAGAAWAQAPTTPEADAQQDEDQGRGEVPVGAGTTQATTTGTSGPRDEPQDGPGEDPAVAPPASGQQRPSGLCEDLPSAVERARCEEQMRRGTGGR